MTRVGIVVTLWDEWFWTERALEALHRTTLSPAVAADLSMYVVDNGSNARNAERVVDFGHWAEAKVIRFEENVGYIKAANAGWQAALDDGCDFILSSNNDVDVSLNNEDCLAQLLSCMSDPQVGAVGPISNYVFAYQSCDLDRQVGEEAIYSLMPVHEVPFLVYFFVMLRAEALRKVGLLDERYGIGGNDDLDHSIALREAGYKLLVDRDVFITHYGSKTLIPRYGREGYDQMNVDTRKVLIEKWGEAKVAELFEHQIELIPQGVAQ